MSHNESHMILAEVSHKPPKRPALTNCFPTYPPNLLSSSQHNLLAKTHSSWALIQLVNLGNNSHTQDVCFTYMTCQTWVTQLARSTTIPQISWHNLSKREILAASSHAIQQYSHYGGLHHHKRHIPASLAQLVAWLLLWQGGTGFKSQLG